MSFVYKEGFEYASAAEYAARYTELLTSGSLSCSLVTGRRSGKALRTSVGTWSASTGEGYALIDHSGTEIVLGVALKSVTSIPAKVDNRIGFFQAADLSKKHCTIKLTQADITVYDSSDSAVGSYSVALNSDFVYLEIHLNTVAGTLKVYVQEDLVLDLTGDFSASAGDAIAYWGFGQRSYNPSSGYTCYLVVDDVYVDTDTRRGDLAILYWPPTSDVSVDFTPSTGTDNYALVDEIPESDTDYNESALVGDADIYGHSSTLGSITGDILAVDVLGRVNVPDGGIGSGIIPKLKIGGTEYSGTQINGTTVTKENISGEFLLSPATGVAFTQAEAEAMDFGWEIGS